MYLINFHFKGDSIFHHSLLAEKGAEQLVRSVALMKVTLFPESYYKCQIVLSNIDFLWFCYESISFVLTVSVLLY